MQLPTILLRFAQLSFCKCKTLLLSSFTTIYFVVSLDTFFSIFVEMISYFLLVTSCFIALCSFFTNTLILPIVNGPTEGLMLIYLCHFFTFFTGTIWFKVSIFMLIRSLLIHCHMYEAFPQNHVVCGIYSSSFLCRSRVVGTRFSEVNAPARLGSFYFWYRCYHTNDSFLYLYFYYHMVTNFFYFSAIFITCSWHLFFLLILCKSFIVK